MQYTLKMCIVCHSASVILEQFAKVNVLQSESQESKYLRYQSKTIWKDWIKAAFTLRSTNDNMRDKGKKGKKGKEKKKKKEKKEVDLVA